MCCKKLSQSQAKQLMSLASVAAIAAGKAILKVYAKPFEVVDKDDGSPVTLADIESSRIIKETLASTGFPFVSEEDCPFTYSERAAFPIYWLVDPLDGTKEFVKHNGEFTVNIALMVNHKPIAGIIYSPVFDTLWLGFDHEAYRVEKASTLPHYDFDDLVKNADKLPLKPSERRYTILVSRSHRSAQVDEYINGRILPHHPDATIKPLGSTLKATTLTEGNADIYVCYSRTKEWDTAAAQALLEASGGQVYRISDNQPLEYGKEDFGNPPFVAICSAKH